jgi:hypothetical protein
MSRILQRQVVVVHRATNGDIPFGFNLDLDFVPSSVIVRTIAYRRNTGSGLHGIKCSWLKARSGLIGVLVGSANDDFISNPNTIFQIKNGASILNGDVLFNLVKLGDNETEEQLDGVLGLTLEFIQEDIPEPKPKSTDIDKLINFLKTEKASRDIYPFNPVSTQLGKGHGCMCGGQVATEDDRNSLQQVEPIPDVTSQVEMSEGQEPIATQFFEEQEQEEEQEQPRQS